MLERLEHIPKDVMKFLLDVVLASFLAISIKIAVAMKKGKMSLTNAILSIIIGVGVAALCGQVVIHYFSEFWVPIVSGIITIIGEKIANWLIYKMKVDELMEDLLKYLTRKK